MTTRWVPIKAVADLSNDVLSESTPPEYIFEYVDIGNVTSDGRIAATETMTFGQAPSRARRRVKPGDVVVSTVRTYLKAIAPIDDDQADLVASTGFAVLHPRHERVVPRFLAYAMRSASVVGSIMAHSDGVSYPAIAPSKLTRLVLPMPSREEQELIAAFLDEETARIDAVIEKKHRMAALLREEWDSVVQAILFGRDDEDRILDDTGVEWLGRVPSDWRVLRAGLLFRQRDQRGEPDLPQLEVSLSKGVVLRQFSGERIERVAADLGDQKVARKGDLVFNKMRMWQGAVGVAPADGLVSPDYTVAMPARDILATYAQLVLKTQRARTEIDKWSHGMVRDRNRLYWAGFRNIRLPVPPLDEQHRILDRVQTGSSRVESLCSKIELASARLLDYRSALITAAVTGQIDVRKAA